MFNQHYHNVDGAISENKHVFFETNGLYEALKSNQPINILEIGLGTGLNALLLLDAYLGVNSNSKINYHTIEAYPITAKTFEQLNYNRFLTHPGIAKSLNTVFDSLQKGSNHFYIHANIWLTVFYGPFADYKVEQPAYDFVLHDAFSPDANPELWTDSVFLKIKKWCKPSAILTTYCAAAKARGAMAAGGWLVARASGALGKREMTVASPTNEALKLFKRVNEKRLSERYINNEFS